MLIYGCLRDDPTIAAGTFHIGSDLSSYPFPGSALNSDYNLSFSSDPVAGWDGGFAGRVFDGESGLNLMKDTACIFGVEQHSVYRNILFTGPNNL